MGSDATPLLNPLGDPLYYISGFLTFISYHDINKQFLLDRHRPKPRELVFTVLPLSIRSFIHRINYLGISISSYFDFYEVSFFATADKNRFLHDAYVESLFFSSIY